MATVTFSLKKNAVPPKEVIDRINAAYEKRDSPSYDEENPPLTDKELAKIREQVKRRA